MIKVCSEDCGEVKNEAAFLKGENYSFLRMQFSIAREVLPLLGYTPPLELRFFCPVFLPFLLSAKFFKMGRDQFFPVVSSLNGPLRSTQTFSDVFGSSRVPNFGRSLF